MKHTLKKALVWLLTLAMAVPMFAFGANAALISVTEDFSQTTEVDSTAFTFTTANGWKGQIESGKAAPQAVDTNGDFTFTFSETAGSVYYLIAPESFAGKAYYTLTGTVKAEGTNTMGYYRLFVNPDVNNPWTSTSFIHLAKNGTAFQTGTAGGGYDGNTIAADQTIGFKAIRNAAEMTVIFYPAAEGADSENAITLTQTLGSAIAGSATALPVIRFQGSEATGAGNVVTLTVDDLVLTEQEKPRVAINGTADNTLPDAWWVKHESFDGEKTTYWDITDDKGKKPTDTAVSLKNGTLVFDASTSGKNYLLTAKEELTEIAYSFSGEFTYSKALTATYTRIHVRPFAGDFSYTGVIHFGGGSDQLYIAIMNNGGSAAGAQTPMLSIKQFEGKTLQFCYTRYTDGTLTFSLCEKGDRAALNVSLTYAIDDDAHLTKKSKPQLRFQDGAAQPAGTTIVFDNIRLDNVTADAADLVGAQVSKETANDTADTKYAVRFVATVDSDAYAKAGFIVSARNADGSVAKTWTVDTCTLHDQIIGSTATGTETYTAEELGGKYLIALTVNDIPKSIASLTFTAEAFTVSQDGYYTYYSGQGSIVATVAADNTVSLAAPAAADA